MRNVREAERKKEGIKMRHKADLTAQMAYCIHFNMDCLL